MQHNLHPTNYYIKIMLDYTQVSSLSFKSFCNSRFLFLMKHVGVDITVSDIEKRMVGIKVMNINCKKL